MRKMLISKVPPGMTLGKALFSANGHVLLADGAQLNAVYLKRLQALGFPAILVKENFCNGLIYPEIVSDKTRIDSTVTIRYIFEEAKKYKRIDTGTVKSLVNQLVDEVLQNRKNLFEISDVRSFDSYIFAHCINVCILALRIGLLLDYNELQLRDLGIGAVLHDIGMVFVDAPVLEKLGKLTPAEFEKVKLHSMDGFNVLRDQKDINLLSAHVALQHHERFDGAGYPRQLKKAEICEFARVVAIADVFDALTSENKYRKSFSQPVAIEILCKEVGKQVDPGLADLFLKNIAMYPTGSLVELNSGEIGLVVSNIRPDTSRPIIRVLTDKNKRVPSSGVFPEVDLRSTGELTVTKLVEDDTISVHIHKLFEMNPQYLNLGQATAQITV